MGTQMAAATQTGVTGFWRKIDAFIQSLSDFSRWVAFAAIMILLGLGIADIIGTRVFGKAVPSAIELQEVFEAMLIFFSIIVVQHERAHLRVDLITNKLGKGGARACEALALICTLILFVLLTWQAYQLGMRSWNALEDSPGFFTFPLYPFKLGAFVACSLVVLETTRQLVRLHLGKPDDVNASFTKDDILP